MSVMTQMELLSGIKSDTRDMKVKIDDFGSKPLLVKFDNSHTNHPSVRESNRHLIKIGSTLSDIDKNLVGINKSLELISTKMTNSVSEMYTNINDSQNDNFRELIDSNENEFKELRESNEKSSQELKDEMNNGFNKMSSMNLSGAIGSGLKSIGTAIMGMVSALGLSRIVDRIDDARDAQNNAINDLMRDRGVSERKAREYYITQLNGGILPYQEFTPYERLQRKNENREKALTMGVNTAKGLSMMGDQLDRFSLIMPEVAFEATNMFSEINGAVDESGKMMNDLFSEFDNLTTKYWVDNDTLVKVTDSYTKFFRFISKNSKDFQKNMTNMARSVAKLEDSFLGSEAILGELTQFSTSSLSTMDSGMYSRMAVLGLNPMQIRQMMQGNQQGEAATAYTESIKQFFANQGYTQGSGIDERFLTLATDVLGFSQSELDGLYDILNNVQLSEEEKKEQERLDLINDRNYRIQMQVAEYQMDAMSDLYYIPPKEKMNRWIDSQILSNPWIQKIYDFLEGYGLDMGTALGFATGGLFLLLKPISSLIWKVINGIVTLPFKIWSYYKAKKVAKTAGDALGNVISGTSEDSAEYQILALLRSAFGAGFIRTFQVNEDYEFGGGSGTAGKLGKSAKGAGFLSSAWAGISSKGAMTSAGGTVGNIASVAVPALGFLWAGIDGLVAGNKYSDTVENASAGGVAAHAVGGILGGNTGYGIMDNDKSGWEKAGGILGGAAKGAMIGSLGGPVGMAIGGVIGAGFAAIGGETIAELFMSEDEKRSKREAKAEAKAREERKQRQKLVDSNFELMEQLEASGDITWKSADELRNKGIDELRKSIKNFNDDESNRFKGLIEDGQLTRDEASSLGIKLDATTLETINNSGVLSEMNTELNTGDGSTRSIISALDSSAGTLNTTSGTLISTIQNWDPNKGYSGSFYKLEDTSSDSDVYSLFQKKLGNKGSKLVASDVSNLYSKLATDARITGDSKFFSDNSYAAEKMYKAVMGSDKTTVGVQEGLKIAGSIGLDTSATNTLINSPIAMADGFAKDGEGNIKFYKDNYTIPYVSKSFASKLGVNQSYNAYGKPVDSNNIKAKINHIYPIDGNDKYVIGQRTDGSYFKMSKKSHSKTQLGGGKFGEIKPEDLLLGGSTASFAPAPKKHFTGLDYVPYDGYLAELHKGESVLTKTESDARRKGIDSVEDIYLSNVKSPLEEKSSVDIQNTKLLDEGMTDLRVNTTKSAELVTSSNTNLESSVKTLSTTDNALNTSISNLNSTLTTQTNSAGVFGELASSVKLISDTIKQYNEEYNKGPTYGGGSRGSTSMLRAAQSQVGIREASNGYTKYGDYMGVPTSAWCAAFVSWCANQAGIGPDELTQSAAAEGIRKGFVNSGRYEKSLAYGGNYIPMPGDVISFTGINGGPTNSHHVGIVESVANGIVKTIEGNSSNAVSRRSYSLDDDYIIGYGRMNGDNLKSAYFRFMDYITGNGDFDLGWIAQKEVGTTSPIGYRAANKVGAGEWAYGRYQLTAKGNMDNTKSYRNWLRSHGYSTVADKLGSASGNNLALRSGWYSAYDDESTRAEFMRSQDKYLIDTYWTRPTTGLDTAALNKLGKKGKTVMLGHINWTGGPYGFKRAYDKIKSASTQQEALQAYMDGIRSYIRGVSNYSKWKSGFENRMNSEAQYLGVHENGLLSVPYDGYLAKLHTGERVLTKAEADAYRLSEENTIAKLNTNALREQNDTHTTVVDTTEVVKTIEILTDVVEDGFNRVIKKLPDGPATSFHGNVPQRDNSLLGTV